MSLFKCKMCGGDLEIAEGVTIAECEYCGTKQTVPKAMDENLQNLFNRANTLRIKSEFDKAEKLYEKIIQADTTQSEAYWGLILCKYGIEYVDDPATFKKIPTCHRASYDSIIADDDYKSALENADPSQRAIYEEQAKEIDRIQKDILALAQKEETYDVFICYKETDADGKRTQDSVIANDIYYQLTQEGFKVFYAAITLEGKLGSAYEPIIFAALNSAKVMLSIGTKPEYFNAVWVKNEWSRFLKIIKKDRSKLLIPCYRDMDAYELPDEFAHLQAQDMSKIGFINDVVRGIKKVLQKDEAPKETFRKEAVVTVTSTNITPLLKRAFMFLEDSDWDRADALFEQVLNQDPECAQAYVGKLMAELHIEKQGMLKNCEESFEDKYNYKKALRFGDEELTVTLRGYIDFILTRNESTRLANIYKEASDLMEKNLSESYLKAETLFVSISHYQDAAELGALCRQKVDEIQKDKIYQSAMAKINGSLILNNDPCYKYHSAIKLLESIPGWQDADDQILICRQKIEELEAKAEADRLEKAHLAEEERKKAKRKKKIVAIIIPIICAIISFVIILNTIIIPNDKLNDKYNKTSNLLNQGNYTEAINIFRNLDNSTKSAEQIKRFEELYISKIDSLIIAGYYSTACILLLEDQFTIQGEPILSAYKNRSSTNFKTFKKGVTSLVIPKGITTIPDNAFEGFTSLTSIDFPSGLTYIGDSAFYNCTSLTSIDFPSGLTSIGDSAFYNCTNLASIDIPSSIKNIHASAFSHCRKLKQIVFWGSMEQWNKITKGILWDYKNPRCSIRCYDGTITK